MSNDTGINPDDSRILTEKLLKQMLELWIEPEVKRRIADGKISGGPYVVNRAQVLFFVDREPLIRLNDEVKVIVKAKMNRPIKKGEVLYEKDVEEIQDLLLLDEERDFGHITAFRFRDSWIITFNFIYDVSKSEKFFEIGLSFLRSANDNYKREDFRPMIEDLSVAAENLAKARIYLHPDQEIRKTKKHGTVWSKVNKYAQSNIISTNQKDGFNQLMKYRDRARYDPEFMVQKKEATTLLDAVVDLKVSVGAILSRHGKVGS